MRRIIFVDDEPKVLDGLRRMLRPMRREWEMAFVSGGREALALLEEQPFDVVVSDMRMPGMDGVEFLTEVMRRHPRTVRIALSGHSKKEMILRAVGPTHQYLAKPCDAQLLKNVVARACALRDVLANDEIRQTVSRMQSLPSLPSLYVKIMEEVRKPDASIKAVGEIIRADVGMAAKILQLVNSAFFGLCHHVADPAEAVALLGLDTIRALVLSASVFTQFEDANNKGLNLDVFQSHSMAVGSLARRIAKAEQCDDQTCDHSFMAGMLHDAGKLVLAVNLPDQYRQALTLARREKLMHHEAERRIFGASHAEVGAYLFGLWGMPDPIVEGLTFHHSPDSSLADAFSPLTAVHVADALEHQCGDEEHSLSARRLDLKYLERLGLAERLPVWRELAANCCQVEQTS